MSTLKKTILLEIFFLILLLLGAGLSLLGPAGTFLFLFLFAFWCWELFAYLQYRFSRQEEFLHVLQTAAATKAPIEGVLRSYLRERPTQPLYRFWVSLLLFFVFPGYYWIHKRRSFDARVHRLMEMLYNGVPLDRSLCKIQGLVPREIALAVTVGQFSGQLTETLRRLPDRRTAPIWLELVPRFAYPLLILFVMGTHLSFLMIFIIPKFEKIFSDFRMKLPFVTEMLIAGSRWFVKYGAFPSLLWLLLLVLINVLIFSSRARWSFPLVGWLYQMHARGQFLQTLGVMLETGKPLPVILDCVLASELLPRAVEMRVDRLAEDLNQGLPLAPSLVQHGLATESMQALIASAEKAQNLPWALQELGDSLIRRCARLCYRIALVAFPLCVVACAFLVGLVAVGMFIPLLAMLDGLSGAGR